MFAFNFISSALGKRYAGPLIIEQTAKAVFGKSVAIIEDTTEVNSETHINYLSLADGELGPVGKDKETGFFMHPSIVVGTNSEMLLGVSDVYIWNTAKGKVDKHERQYVKQPIEEKESNRLLASV